MERIELEDYMLIEIGCKLCNVMPFEVTSDVKDKKIVDARSLCFWMLYKYTEMSYKDIGLIFNKSYGTVSAAIGNVKSSLRYKDTEKQTKLAELAVMAGEIVSIIIKQKQHELDQKKSENSILCCNNSDGNSNTFSSKEVCYELTD